MNQLRPVSILLVTLGIIIWLIASWVIYPQYNNTQNFVSYLQLIKSTLMIFGLTLTMYGLFYYDKINFIASSGPVYKIAHNFILWLISQLVLLAIGNYLVIDTINLYRPVHTYGVICLFIFILWRNRYP
jgi:hypothetical protein